MISYNLFSFAAPPSPTAEWCTQVLNEVGLGAAIQTDHMLHADADRLRVGLVHHPLLWLSVCYKHHRVMQGPHEIVLFYSLSAGTFTEYVGNYLLCSPGAIGRLAAAYNNDTQMRAEDMPWAMQELLASVGVAARSLPQCPSIDRLCLPDGMARRVMEAEREYCDAFGYW